MYIYQAAILCDDCAESSELRCGLIAEGRTAEDDSDYWPYGPFDPAGQETDSPDCCAMCNVFIPTRLTADGVQYVKDALAEYMATGRGSREVLDEWSHTFGIPWPD